MKLKVQVDNGSGATTISLQDGDETNAEHFDKLETAKQLLPAFDRFLHGFDQAGNLVIIPMHAVSFVSVVEA